MYECTGSQGIEKIYRNFHGKVIFIQGMSYICCSLIKPHYILTVFLLI